MSGFTGDENNARVVLNHLRSLEYPSVSGQTVNATPLPLALLAVPPTSLVIGDIVVFGRSLTGVFAAWKFSDGALFRNGAAPIVLDAHSKVAKKQAAAALWDANISMAAGNIVVTVTGGAGETIDWNALGTLQLCTPTAAPFPP